MKNSSNNKVTIYSKGYCPYCKAAKRILQAKGIEYVEIDVEVNPEKMTEMLSRSHRRTVPQIFFGEQHIGGHDDLVRYYTGRAA
ncbi:MAG: glutaredoxin 3 [Arenicella sp.]|nr:glutaredoxin 3 [Arenicella sp.]